MFSSSFRIDDGLRIRGTYRSNEVKKGPTMLDQLLNAGAELTVALKAISGLTSRRYLECAMISRELEIEDLEEALSIHGPDEGRVR